MPRPSPPCPLAPQPESPACDSADGPHRQRQDRGRAGTRAPISRARSSASIRRWSTRHMDIGTAKPDLPTRLRRAAPPDRHHRAARNAIRRRSSATTRWRRCATSPSASGIPLLVGGTMLYFKALREGLSELPEADPEIRMVIDTMAAETGWPAVHRELGRIDPATARRLDPNDCAAHPARAGDFLPHRQTDVGTDRAAAASADLPYRLIPIALIPGERERAARAHRVTLRGNAGTGADQRGARAARGLRP